MPENCFIGFRYKEKLLNFRFKHVGKIGKIFKRDLKELTYPRRLNGISSFQKLATFCPHMISNSSTPKLKTSDFSENLPLMAYSGAIYPLRRCN